MLTAEQLIKKYKLANDILNEAIVTNCLEDVQAALMLGADIGAADTRGFTPLHYAAACCKSKDIFIEILKCENLNIEITTPDLSGKPQPKVTPLILACQVGNKEAVEILLENGADTAAKVGKNTALFFSCTKGFCEVTLLLLEHKADPNVVLDMGMTSLHIACKSGRQDIVKILLDHDANPFACNDAGNSVFDYAKDSQDKEIIDQITSACKTWEQNHNEASIAENTTIIEGAEGVSDDVSILGNKLAETDLNE